MAGRRTINIFERLYGKYNRREFVHPDPLEFLYNYSDPRDVEIAGLIASSLAYGNVKQILKSVDKVLSQMAPSPFAYIKKTDASGIRKQFKGFKHRFTTGGDISFLLAGIKSAVEKYGSLEKCFMAGFKKEHETILEALSAFQNRLNLNLSLNLLPSPCKGSACKRLNLFLRWMVRKDGVDPGIWNEVPKEKLIIPLDTHMHKISLKLGFTKRKQANMKTAVEITGAFAKYSPDDPVKYDFVLTRFGIHDELKKIPLKEAFYGKQDVLLPVRADDERKGMHDTGCLREDT